MKPKPSKKSPPSPPGAVASIVGEVIVDGIRKPAPTLSIYRHGLHGESVVLAVDGLEIFLTRSQARALSTAVWASSLWRG